MDSLPADTRAHRDVSSTDFRSISSLKEIPEFQLFSLAIVHSVVNVPYSIQARYILDESASLDGTTLTFGFPIIAGTGEFGHDLEIVAKDHWVPFLRFLVGDIPGGAISFEEHSRQVAAGITRNSNFSSLPKETDIVKVPGGLTFIDFDKKEYWKIQQRMVSCLDPFEVFHGSVHPNIIRLPVFTVSGNMNRVEVSQAVNYDRRSLAGPIYTATVPPDPEVVAEAKKAFCGGAIKK